MTELETLMLNIKKTLENTMEDLKITDARVIANNIMILTFIYPDEQEEDATFLTFEEWSKLGFFDLAAKLIEKICENYPQEERVQN